MHGKLFKKLFALFVLFGMPLAACSTSSGNNNNNGYYLVNPTPSPSTTYTPQTAMDAVCKLTGTQSTSDGQGGYYTEIAWQASQTSVSQVKSSVSSSYVPSGFSMSFNWQSSQFSDGTPCEYCTYVAGSIYLDYVVYQMTYQGTSYVVLQVYSYTDSGGGGNGGGGGGSSSYTTLSAIQAVCQLMGTSDYESDGQGGYYVGTFWESSQVTVSQVKSSVSQIVPTGFSMSSSWQSSQFSDGTPCEYCTYVAGSIYLDYVVYQMTYQGTSYVVLQVYSYTDSGGGGGGGGSSSYTTLEVIQWVANVLGVSYYSGDDYYYVSVYTNYSSSSVSSFKSLVTGSLIPPSFSLAQSWQSGTYSDGIAYEACYYICDSVVLGFTIYNETYEGSQITVLEVIAFYSE